MDLIKDEATRMPATEEADYVVSRYFFPQTSCLCSVCGPKGEGAHPTPWSLLFAVFLDVPGPWGYSKEVALSLSGEESCQSVHTLRWAL